MNRRGFLGAILAAGAAPAVVKYANLMPMFRRTESGLLTPLWGTSIAAQIAGKQREFNQTLDDLIYEINPVETPLIAFQYKDIHATRDMYDVLGEICSSQDAVLKIVKSGDWKAEVKWLKANNLKFS